MKHRLPRVASAAASADAGHARAYALRVIKFRERTEKELRGKLLTRGYAPEVIDQVVTALKRSRLIDDTLFARLWVQGRVKRPLGANRLRHELQKKGVASGTIEEALKSVDIDEPQVVRALVREKLQKMRGLEPQKKKARLFGQLIRRGFSHNTVVDILIDEIPYHETVDDE